MYVYILSGHEKDGRTDEVQSKILDVYASQPKAEAAGAEWARMQNEYYSEQNRNIRCSWKVTEKRVIE